MKQLDQASPRFFSKLRYPLVVLKTLLMNPRTEVDIVSKNYRYSGSVLSVLIGKGQFFMAYKYLTMHSQRVAPYVSVVTKNTFVQTSNTMVAFVKGNRVPEHLKHVWHCEECQIITDGLPVQEMVNILALLLFPCDSQGRSNSNIMFVTCTKSIRHF